MADSKAEPTAAAGHTNSVQPGPVDQAAAAAEVKPCGCEDRVSALEGRWSAQDALNKAMSWCLLACAAAVLYLVWTSAGTGSKDTADK